jgi:hypothetical protein
MRRSGAVDALVMGGAPHLEDRDAALDFAVDLGNVEQLKRHLEDLITGSWVTVVVDVRDLEFIDV